MLLVSDNNNLFILFIIENLGFALCGRREYTIRSFFAFLQ